MSLIIQNNGLNNRKSLIFNRIIGYKKYCVGENRVLCRGKQKALNN